MPSRIPSLEPKQSYLVSSTRGFPISRSLQRYRSPSARSNVTFIESTKSCRPAIARRRPHGRANRGDLSTPRHSWLNEYATFETAIAVEAARLQSSIALSRQFFLKGAGFRCRVFGEWTILRAAAG